MTTPSPRRQARETAIAVVVATVVASAIATPPAQAASGETPTGKLAARTAITDLRGASHVSGPPQEARPNTEGTPMATAAAFSCAAVRRTDLQDRIVLHTGATGATSVVIERTRQGGRSFRLATISGSQAVWVDRAIHPAALPTYVLRFTFPDGTTKTCTRDVNLLSPDDLLLGDHLSGSIAAAPAPNPSLSSFDEMAPRDSYTPSASADGRWMAYAAAPGGAGDDLDLYMRRADGRGGGVLLASSDADDWEPAFSHDGQWLAYSSTRDNQGLGLTVVDLVTGVARAVPGSSGLVEASWTPDGRLLATDIRSDTALLALVHPTTGARSTLAGSAGGWAPDVSDEGHIAYAAPAADGRVQIRRVVSGQTSVRATLESGHTVADLSWSHHNLSVNSTYGPRGLYLVDAVLGQDGGYASSVDTLSWAGERSRNAAGRPVTWLDARRVLSTGTSDLTGDGQNDLLARDRSGVLWIYPADSDTGWEQHFGTRLRVGSNWQSMGQFLAAGDLTADSRGDVLARDTSGVLWLYPGTGRPSAPLAARVRVGGGWGSYFVLGTGDLDGDTAADVLARDASGNLWLYPGGASGGRGAPVLGPRRLVGRGWNTMNALVGAGDVNYDGHPDVLARERSTGVLWLYVGDGRGGFATRRSMGSGWAGFTAFAGTENLVTPINANGLIVRNSLGELEWHPSQGDGKIPAGLWWQQTKGWNGYTVTG